MAETMTVAGVLVGTDSYPYSFTGEGGKLVEGQTRKAWVVTGSGEPTLVQFRDPELFGRVSAADQFSNVELVVELGASGNKIRRTVVQVSKVTKP